MKMQIDRNLIKLIEEYTGSLKAFSDIGNVSLYYITIFRYMVMMQMNYYQSIRLYSMFQWMNFILMTISRKKEIRYSVS